MEFTYDAYRNLVELILDKGYEICDYESIRNAEKGVILRHDVDNSIEKAHKFAQIEYDIMRNVKSTYFILITSDFYNIYSQKSQEQLRDIIKMGHDIGLHFDEKRYDINSIDDIKKYVDKEVNILEMLLEHKVSSVSMHRPSKIMLNNDIKFKGLINSYGQYFFNDIKYLSDSRINWREDVISIVKSAKYKKLQILTHAFSYSDKVESVEEKIVKYIENARVDRWDILNKNFTNLEEVMKRPCLE